MDEPVKVVTRPRNPRGQGDRLRETLLAAAIELLADLEDWQSLSVRTLTARVGVSPTALYLHFQDKDALLAAVKERCFEELGGYVREAAARAGDDPRRQAHAMCLAYLRFASEQPGYYRAVFHVPHHEAAPAAQSLEAAMPDWPAAATLALGDLISGIARCLPEAARAEPVATMVWTGLHGYATLRRAVPHYPFPSAETYTTTLLDAHLGNHGARG